MDNTTNTIRTSTCNSAKKYNARSGRTISNVLLFVAVSLFLSGCVKDPVIPVLKTISVTDITMNSVVCGGEIIDDGGAPVTAKGVCWGVDTEPVFEGFHTDDGTGSGSFSTAITGLDPNTLYYIRAFAVNSAGIAYGNEISFTTSAAAAVITTNNISDISVNGAVSGGVITYDGNAEITDKGVCWSTGTLPEITDSFKSAGSGPGSFTSSMTGLLPGTRYYVRAYAVNSAGTVYGEQKTFNTMLSDIEGNTYRTVTIGSQVWMAENLRSTRFNDNTDIPNIEEDAEWISTTSPAWCWMLNDIRYKETFGALYNWYAVNSGKLCPSGWHIPSDEEYKTLELFLGMPVDQVGLWDWRGTDQGTQMKSTTGWADGENGTNSSGFSALPGGYRYGATGAFNALGVLTYWWSSEYSDIYAVYRRVDGNTGEVFRNATSKKGGKYVRCV